ncbi:MAG: family 78 glycoside hydrolase catalytic domain, partial [Armatimonadota bacterium]|nr:family 78 glycoside hydrolase catalytic domain [Armatimonadota bacterium]
MNEERWQGYWIWCAEEVPARNAWVRFRRRFSYHGGPARLHLTADARYVLYLNGKYLGQGPVRAWPQHWRYDSYDLTPELRHGENVVAVLVNHFGESNFQYIAGPPGLLAQLELDGETIVSDTSWRARPDEAFVNAAPRISVQEGFEEQFDARRDDGWKEADYADDDWPPAVVLREALAGPHQNLEPRGIPFLTLEPILPQRIVSAETVQSVAHRFTLHVKPYLVPEDKSSNFVASHAYLATQIFAPHDTAITLLMVMRHKMPGDVRVNGELIEGKLTASTAGHEGQEIYERTAQLRAGWNDVLLSIRHQLHLQEYSFCIDGPADLRFRACGEQSDAEWAVVGPFGLGPEQLEQVAQDKDTSILVAQPRVAAATLERGEGVWQSGDVSALINEPFFQPISREHAPVDDVFLQAYTDHVVRIDNEVHLENADGLLSGADWTTIYPSADGADVRLLLDWGQEVIGFHRFEVNAPAGTILDFHNFEFIQPDGRYNFAEGMNNSSRTICREGHQSYQTYVRRGFTYSYLILRNMSGPVHLRGLQVLFNTYPQSRRGSFTCSDAKLERIWQVGAHTLRLCAEDTYTDCPTYEQTHWVGDARNEALVDLVANGDPRLSRHCWIQAGRSLDRSPIVESQVPSAWENLLPAWSFLWMRWAQEHYQHTGDLDFARTALGFLERNVRGIEEHLNQQGLFEIVAWNMFDWAKMDTPSKSVVTHQNCLAVLGLRQAATLARSLDEHGVAERWTKLADDLSAAINRHLWNEQRKAYIDCIHEDGTPSSV